MHYVATSPRTTTKLKYRCFKQKWAYLSGDDEEDMTTTLVSYTDPRWDSPLGKEALEWLLRQKAGEPDDGGESGVF